MTREEQLAALQLELRRALEEYARDFQAGFDLGLHEISLDEFLATVIATYITKCNSVIPAPDRKQAGQGTVKPLPDLLDSMYVQQQANVLINETVETLRQHGYGIPGARALDSELRNKLIQHAFNYVGALRYKR